MNKKKRNKGALLQSLYEHTLLQLKYFTLDMNDKELDALLDWVARHVDMVRKAR